MEPEDNFIDQYDDTCPNCGGEGVVYDCFEEWACVDPESGCDLCARRCDWCRPLRSPTPSPQESGR
jgi:hypothetical protein